MALFNYAAKEITLKVVYYGPGLCGKTTNLQHLHAMMSPEKKGKLLSLSTESDRTLFFDFMPVALGKIRDFNIKFQLYTVPGQVRYNATRKLVLKGADAIVFVADSQRAMSHANVESLENMYENLEANNIKPKDITLLLQYNKRDLDDIMSIEELDKDLNSANDATIEASAINGMGVNETFKLITKRLLQHISKKHNIQIEIAEDTSELAETITPPSGDISAAAATTAVSMKSSQPDAGSTEIPLDELELEEDLMKTAMPEKEEEEKKEEEAPEEPGSWSVPEEPLKSDSMHDDAPAQPQTDWGTAEKEPPSPPDWKEQLEQESSQPESLQMEAPATTEESDTELQAPEEPASLEAPEEPASLEAPEEPASWEAPEEPASLEAPEEPASLEAPEEPASLEAPEEPALAAPELLESLSQIEPSTDTSAMDTPELLKAVIEELQLMRKQQGHILHTLNNIDRKTKETL